MTTRPQDFNRRNPPGQDKLTYRGANYSTTAQRLVQRLPLEVVTLPDGQTVAPLRLLNTNEQDDWTVALLHAWAVVLDVLNFYQERITNEGYLNTARERLSLIELGHTVGYELQPALAAGTYLSFTVQRGEGEPHRHLLIPKGSAVLSVPESDDPPQTFETSVALLARSEWNGLRLRSYARSEFLNLLPRDANSMRLAGLNSNLQPGDVLLVVEQPPEPGEATTMAPAAAEPAWFLAEITAVTPNFDNNYTTLTWRRDQASRADGPPLVRPALFVLRRQAGLFPFTRTGVFLLPQAGRAWQPAGIGLPPVTVQAWAENDQGHLFAATEKDLYRSRDGGATWHSTPVDPAPKNVIALARATDSADLFAAADDGGLYISKNGGQDWRKLGPATPPMPPKLLKKWAPLLFSGPLPKTVVHSLTAFDYRGKQQLIAGTEAGVFQSTDQGQSWRPRNLNLPKLDMKTLQADVVVNDLASKAKRVGRDLFAATDAGVFRVTRPFQPWKLLLAALLALFVYSQLSNTTLLIQLASRLSGILAQLNEAISGLNSEVLAPVLEPLKGLIGGILEPLAGLAAKLAEPIELSLPDALSFLNGLAPIVADYLLLVAAFGALLYLFWKVRASLDRRSFRCIGQPVLALTMDGQGRLYAGTDSGLYRSNVPGAAPGSSRLARLWGRVGRFLYVDLFRSWTLVDETRDWHVLDLNVAGQDEDEILAGLADGRVFHSQDQGATWQLAAVDLPLTEAHAVARSEAGLFAAGAPAKPEVEPLWSPWQREAPALYLDGPYDNAPQEGYVVLHQPGGQARPLLATIGRAFTADSGDANTPMTVTVLSLDTDDDPGYLDRLSSLVRFAAEPLPLYDDKPVAGQELIFDDYVPDLFAGQRLIISGRRMRARYAGQDQTFQLFSADGLVAKNVPAHEPLLILDVVSDPDRDPIADQQSWRLQSRTGVTGYAGAGTPLIMAPAQEDDPIISEVAVILLVDNSRPRTRIVLEQPLQRIYDRAGLRLRANVVHASHGRTVVNEVLGNSDGSVANLKLKLRQRPLTYTSSEDGLQSSLAVTINGVTWHEAEYLTGLARDERAYMVRQDEDENSTVIFGDGRQGARPPSTREEVRATYRIGSGPKGNVTAGALSLPQRVPHGIDGVTNPLPASGGAPPETIDQARRSIPRYSRALARIISLDDYVDFARTFAGIGKVQSELFSQPQRDLLHLTVGDAGGAPLPEDGDLLRNLRRAIERQRIAAVPEVRVASYEPLYFQVTATITIDPDYRPRLPQMAAAIKAALIEHFAFDRRDFGQSVTAAEILALVQPLMGVAGLRLEALAIVESGTGPGDGNGPPPTSLAAMTLPARRAILKGDRVLPAQLLLLNQRATDWLTLRWEDAK
jgi:photosystem II stability/assembly factor-like uncharacterized protein